MNQDKDWDLQSGDIGHGQLSFACPISGLGCTAPLFQSCFHRLSDKFRHCTTVEKYLSRLDQTWPQPPWIRCTCAQQYVIPSFNGKRMRRDGSFLKLLTQFFNSLRCRNQSQVLTLSKRSVFRKNLQNSTFGVPTPHHCPCWQRCPHQCSGKPPACKEHTKIHREKNAFLVHRNGDVLPFACTFGTFSWIFAFRLSIISLLDCTTRHFRFLLVLCRFRKLRLQCFPRILCRMHRLVTQMARPCSDVKNARFHGIRTQKWKHLNWIY